VDTFHKDRWDYVYRYEKAGTLQEHRRIVAVFQDEKLVRIEGDVVAAKPGTTDGGVLIDKPAPETAAAAAARGDAAKGSEEKPKEEKPKEERGFFGRMLDRLGF
jgi:outer membrane protein assembly factor BamE